MLPPHPPRPNVVAALPRCDLLFGFLLVGLERRAAPKAWRSVLGGDGGGGGGGVQFPAIPALLNPSTPG